MDTAENPSSRQSRTLCSLLDLNGQPVSLPHGNHDMPSIETVAADAGPASLQPGPEDLPRHAPSRDENAPPFGSATGPTHSRPPINSGPFNVNPSQPSTSQLPGQNPPTNPTLRGASQPPLSPGFQLHLALHDRLRGLGTDSSRSARPSSEPPASRARTPHNTNRSTPRTRATSSRMSSATPARGSRGSRASNARGPGPGNAAPRPIRPATPTRGGASSGGASSSSPSVLATPATGNSTAKRKREDDDDGTNLFSDNTLDGIEVVDLVDKDDIPEELLASQQDNKHWVKLGGLDCVICMDNVTDLTVTHCGHLFCSACLHSALEMDANRRICPICRQKIDRIPQNGKYSSRHKGFYPLELKFKVRPKSNNNKAPVQQKQEEEQA